MIAWCIDKSSYCIFTIYWYMNIHILMEMLCFQFAGELLDASISRSPSAYLNNPASECGKYKYNVDKEMTLLKFVDDQWGPVGSFNWFATHGTSMSRTNSLISGDNKGAAARFMEDWFEQSNAGHSSADELVSEGIPRRVSDIISDFRNNRKLLSVRSLNLKKLLHLLNEFPMQIMSYWSLPHHSNPPLVRQQLRF